MLKQFKILFGQSDLSDGGVLFEEAWFKTCKACAMKINKMVTASHNWLFSQAGRLHV